MFSNKFDSMNLTFVLFFPLLYLATSSALLLISLAKTSDLSPRKFERETAIAPLPVHKSNIFILTFFRSNSLHFFKVSSTIISVSGCGISTFSFTKKFNPINSWLLVIYCNGLPLINLFIFSLNFI